MQASYSETSLVSALPVEAEPHATEIAEIERELDRIWPGYDRLPNVVKTPQGPAHMPGYKLKGRPFTVSGMPAPPYTLSHVKRLKWLLKRHSLLMRGLDFGVVVSSGAGRQEGKCFAHPIESAPEHHPAPPPKVSPVALPAAPGQAAPVLSAPRLALEAGRSLEAVEAALDAMPEGADALVWVKQWGRG
jgi:hypothetical protein